MTRTGQSDLFENGASLEDAAAAFDQPPSPAPSALARRLAEYGPQSLAEVESLTLLLQRCAPTCRDPALAAQALLCRFGCWARVFGAGLPELARVVGEGVASDLKLVQDLLLRALEFEMGRRPVIGSQSAVRAYLRAALAGQARESFRVLFLDTANGLIADEAMGEGTVNHAPVYPREVMRRSLELNALCLCLVHNHPSGAATPSRADIEITRQTIEAGRALGISVHDHFLIAGDEVVSFRTLGLI